MTQDAPYVTVVWGDAFSQPATAYISIKEARKIHKPMRSETKGYLIHRDIVGVTIMGERQLDHTDGDRWLYRGHTFIPAGMIIAIKGAKVASAAKKSKGRKPAKTQAEAATPPGPHDTTVMDPHGIFSAKP